MSLGPSGLHARVWAVASSVEAAIAAGNSVARHQIVVSKDFDRMMDCLHQAAEILDGIVIEREPSVVLRFPLRDPASGP